MMETSYLAGASNLINDHGIKRGVISETMHGPGIYLTLQSSVMVYTMAAATDSGALLSQACFFPAAIEAPASDPSL